jgi:predicted transcriptional regulator
MSENYAKLINSIKKPRNRDQLYMIYLLLRVVSEHDKITRTKLMYKTFTSHDEIKSYTSKLLEHGFAIVENKEFSITPKGKTFLKKSSEFINKYVPHQFGTDFDTKLT